MTMSKMKVVTAPLMNANGFALLFSQYKSTQLQLPISPWFEQALSFSVAIIVDDLNSNTGPVS